MRKKVVKSVERMMDILFHWVKIIRIIVVRFIREGFTYRVSALTYTTLLAMVPVFGVLFSFLSLFRVFHNEGARIQHYMFENFVPATGQTLEQYFSNFTTQATKLPPVGIVVLVVVSVMLMFTIERTLNDVWYVKVRRRGVFAFLLYWAIITMGPVFIGLSFAMSSYIVSLSFFASNTTLLGIHNKMLEISPFLFTAVGLTILNLIVPNCRVKFRFAFLGGVVSAIFFELAKQAFANYAYHISNYELIYGAIAIIPLFLVWIYTSWFIILAGTMLAHAAATTEKKYRGPSLNPYLHAFLIIRELWLVQKNSCELSLRMLIRRLEHNNNRIPTDMVLQQLVHSNLVKRTDHGGYMLAFDCERFTLNDLTDRLIWPLPHANDLKKIEGQYLDAIKQRLLKIDEMLCKQCQVMLSELF